MLDTISEYVKNIALFMVLSSVCTILVPDGRLRSAVSLITGIILMLIVLKPVNMLLGAESGESIVQNGIRLNVRAAENSLEQYDRGEQMVLEVFEKNCEDMIKRETGADKIIIRAENGQDGIYIAEVKLYSRKPQGLADKTAALCGIDRDKITVINEQEEEYNEAD